MPTYTVRDPDSNTTLQLKGDSPPTEAELEDIFKPESLYRIISGREAPPPAQLQRTNVEPRSRMPDSSEGFPTTRDGGRVPVASAAEALAEPTEALTNPRFTAPEAKVTEADNPLEVIGKEVWNIGKSVPEFMSSDIGLTLMAAGPAAPVATGAGFTGSMFYDLGKQVLDTYKNWGRLSRNEKIKAIVDIAGTGTLGTLAGLHTAKSLAPETTKAAGVKPIQGPPAMGTMLRTPEGAMPTAAETLAPLTTEAAKETGGEHARGQSISIPLPSDEAPKPVEKVAEGAPGQLEAAPGTQEKAQEVTPAIQTPEGRFVTGEDHVAAYEKAKATGTPDTSGSQEVFVDEAGNVLSREAAAEKTGLPTKTEPGKLHSSDLPISSIWKSNTRRALNEGYEDASLGPTTTVDLSTLAPSDEHGYAPPDLVEHLRAGKPVPPVVLERYPDGTIHIVDGSGRVNAALKAGIKELPAKFVRYGDEVTPKTGLPTQTEPGKLHSSDLPPAPKKPMTLAERAAEEEKKPRVIFDPAIQLAEGQTVTGETHTDIRRGIDKSRLQGSKSGFVDRNTGKFYTLTEAARLQTSGTVIIEPRMFEKGSTTPAPDTSVILSKFQKVAKNKGVAAADRSKLGQLLETARKTGDVKAWQDLQSEVERVAKTVEPPPKAKRKFAIGARSDARTDILDAIQELGGMKPPGKDAGGEYDAWKETMQGTARLLINRSAKHTPDTIINELKDVGMGRIQTPDQLYDAIKNAVAEREKLRTKGGPEEQKAEDFWKAATAPGSTSGLEKVKVDDLQVGDKFRLRFPGASHEELEVTAIDPENYTVTVKDGPSFGTQDLPAGTEIWVQKEKPGTATPPKLRPGEKAGEMFQGEDQPFNLAGETGTDAERIAREKAKAEKTKAEAAEIEKKAQPGLPGTEGEKGPGLVGMGGALTGEVDSGAGSDIYGVAQRVREERAKAGQVGEVKPGQGISAEDSVERGRALLAQGVDPEEALLNFERTKRSSSADMAVTRAHGEELARAARNIEQKFGTESPEYLMANKALTEWDTRTKAMQTEWHKSGQAQQGETDIDTGTFTGLNRAFRESTGRDLPPNKVEPAKRIAKNVTEKENAYENGKQKLFKAGMGQDATPAMRSLAERVSQALDKSAASALERIKARRAEGRLFAAGIDPEQLQDYAIYGASKIAKGVVDFSAWSAEMVKDLGEYIRPHLKQIWEATDKTLDAEVAKVAKGPNAKAQVKSTIKPAEVEPIKPGGKISPAQSKMLWKKFGEYLDKGADNPDDIRNWIATELGLPVKDVTKGLLQKPEVKRIADDVWKKQIAARRAREQAKRWIRDQATPGYIRALEKLPAAHFRIKVAGHGPVALGTHAPMVWFQPMFWATQVRNFGKTFKLMKDTAYYENEIQDLMRRDNWAVARRNGLVNDPFQYEDFTANETAKFFGNITGMGNRGYSVLKILRQDMFDKFWDKLPPHLRTDPVAEELSNWVNHATGTTKRQSPPGTNKLLFAPRLLGSRVMWLAGDPKRAGKIMLNWRNATDAEKIFAERVVKEKAWVFGTMAGMLAINAGILSATGSKQKINVTDPLKSDFLKFKGAGMKFSMGSPMLAMASLLPQLWRVTQGSGGKLKNVVYPDESAYTVLGKYLRGQLAPFASFLTDLTLRGDYQNRPLPHSERPVPKRLRAQGVGPYTWPEYLTQTFSPIPFQEALKEVWKDGLGMSEEQIRNLKKAIATALVMGTTGGRLSDDWDVQ